MQQYFFILGRNPALSYAELSSLLDHLVIKYSILHISSEAVVLETESMLENFNLMQKLGGIVKFGKILNEVGLEEDESKFENVFSTSNLTSGYLPKREGKMHLGMSIYNAGADYLYVTKLFDKLKDLNVSIKEKLKEKGIRIGFVQIKERFLSSVSVFKNDLLTKGVEIVVLVAGDKILVGKTLVVQEFGEFSFRDIGRPKIDKRSGIMPPKLARIMINLGAVEKNQVLLDPFCGSGTVLTEAVVLGYKNITGCDISFKAVADTRSNLDWLFGKFNWLNKSSYNINIFGQNVTSITEKISADSIGGIITEPYLGPPFFRKPDLLTIKKTISELTNLYIQAFTQFYRILRQTGRVVIIFPIFEEARKLYFLEILPQLKKIGFENIELIPLNFQSILRTYITDRKTILYGGNQQFAKREILVFQKK